jgi:hypothetical protein
MDGHIIIVDRRLRFIIRQGDFVGDNEDGQAVDFSSVCNGLAALADSYRD